MHIPEKESIIVLQWAISWPTTTLMAGVHGDELTGIVALRQLLAAWLSIVHGRVQIIFANLKAIVQQVRYVEVNMNRCFGRDESWYEAERAKDIMPYLQRSDFLLDLHNTIDLSAPPFLICEHVELAKYFEVTRMVTWLDLLHPWGSDGYMNAIWKKWLCLECGSIVDWLDGTVPFAKEQIINFLQVIGHLDGTPKIFWEQQALHCRDIYISSSEQFVLLHPFQEFAPIRTGQCIGHDGEMPIYSEGDGYILFARDVQRVGEECFVWAR